MNRHPRSSWQNFSLYLSRTLSTCFYSLRNLHYKKYFGTIWSVLRPFYIASSGVLPIFAEKIFANPMLYHLLNVINFFHFNVPSFNMDFIRHKRISTCAWKFFMMEGSHMKPTTEINTTIDYRKIGAHLKEAAKRTPFRKRKLPHPCT